MTHAQYFASLQIIFVAEQWPTICDQHTSSATINKIGDSAIFHATTAQRLGCEDAAASWRRLVADIHYEANIRAGA